ncbi:MAG: UDP-3-O-(3-hydroxymyristoyl)glucosamine N-acyltransferase [Opitutae bacterium]|nr:UDP-3-O-(3-hydroxymyristoyl)glucosamine N-acyltransferase [Opitutae bacterium]
MKYSISFEKLLELFPTSKVEGSTEQTKFCGISALERATSGDISFLGNAKYKKLVPTSNASVILLPHSYTGTPSHNQIYLKIDDPSVGLACLCKFLEKEFAPSPPAEIHSTAWIDPTAKVGERVSIGAFSFIGKNATVGNNSKIGTHCHVGDYSVVGESCQLYPSVKLLTHCYIGSRVTLNAGVVVGSEGYGFDTVDGVHEKIPHLGKVVIEDDVEIGANTCLDRARFEETRIGKGTKIDNLVQIGHNVRIGNGCLIVAQVGIAGSVKFEDEVVVGGQAGFAGHLTVGKGAKIAGQAGITKNVTPGAFLKGNPALPFKLSQRISILQKRLPELFNRFDAIESND